MTDKGFLQLLEAAPRDLESSLRGVVASLIRMGHPSIAFVAEAADMPVRAFQRRLADAGLTFEKIVAEIRLAEVSRLLVESDQRITDIALELGYSDHAHFTRAFRAWTGSSPLEFRRTHGTRDSGSVRAAAEG